MAWFYGVYLKDSKLATSLDLVRFLCEPRAIRFSHITLRGPLSRKLQETWVDQQNTNRKFEWRVRFMRPSRFMSDTQATIFVNVDLGTLSPLWQKPDFPDGTPHVTLYDGKSQEFASRLRNVLAKYEFASWVPVTKLQIIQKKHKIDEVFHASFEPFYHMFSECIGDPTRIPKMQYSTDNERLKYIDHVLSKNFPLAELRRKSA